MKSQDPNGTKSIKNIEQAIADQRNKFWKLFCSDASVETVLLETSDMSIRKLLDLHRSFTFVVGLRKENWFSAEVRYLCIVKNYTLQLTFHLGQGAVSMPSVLEEMHVCACCIP